jgi:hypothetical protein
MTAHLPAARACVVSRKQKDDTIPAMRCRLTLLSAAAIAAAASLAVTLGVGAVAQTLTNPNPSQAPSRPSSAEPHASAKVKSCSAYGAGFVNVPGTEACVKIGGSVTIGSAINHGR